MSDHKVRDLKDKVVGNVKEATGKVTDNEELEVEGKMQQETGDTRHDTVGGDHDRDLVDGDLLDRDLNRRRSTMDTDLETGLGQDRILDTDTDLDTGSDHDRTRNRDIDRGLDTDLERGETLDRDLDLDVDERKDHDTDERIKVTDDIVEKRDELLDEAEEVDDGPVTDFDRKRKL